MRKTGKMGKIGKWEKTRKKTEKMEKWEIGDGDGYRSPQIPHPHFPQMWKWGGMGEG